MPLLTTKPWGLAATVAGQALPFETDRRTAKKLLELARAMLKDPFEGIGKPEPLKYAGADVWSRRITQEHRCVYLVKLDRVEFLKGRYQG